MRKIFADTCYWIALLKPKDNWYESVIKISQYLSNYKIITTEEVLTSILTFYANSGTLKRKRTVNFVKQIMQNPRIEVMPQNHQSFIAGVHLYEKN